MINVHPLKLELVRLRASQSDLAQELGVNFSMLNAMLNGRRPMPEELERRVREHLRLAPSASE